MSGNGAAEEAAASPVPGDLERVARRISGAPPGVFDARSWAYWHLMLGLTPVPPLPTRRL